MDLQRLSDDERSLLVDMRRHIAEQIAAAGGTLPFDRYMDAALYAPGLGYYVNGRRKFGAGGDFTTAPETSSLFGYCMAQQVAECLGLLGGGDVLEIGAGSGRLAVDVLHELARLGALPNNYLILELSPSLQALQRETLAAEAPEWLARVRWLNALPPGGFAGVVLGNEVLDAMPVHRFRRAGDAWQELAVGIGEHGLQGRWLAAFSPGLERALHALWPDSGLPDNGYVSEINLRLRPWLDALVDSMDRGYLLLVDYGYSGAEYYHSERAMGTLICHYRHQVHDDPFHLPGLQDITASVDFSLLAQAATAAGLALAGYTTQAHFLLDNGLERRIAASDPSDVQRHVQLMQGVKRLTLPGEMGERFKVMALALDSGSVLSGFRMRDLRARL